MAFTQKLATLITFRSNIQKRSSSKITAEHLKTNQSLLFDIQPNLPTVKSSQRPKHLYMTACAPKYKLAKKTRRPMTRIRISSPTDTSLPSLCKESNKSIINQIRYTCHTHDHKTMLLIWLRGRTSPDRLPFCQGRPRVPCFVKNKNKKPKQKICMPYT